MRSSMKNIKSSLDKIKFYSFRYVYPESDHRVIKENTISWSVLRVICSEYEKEIDMGRRNEIELNDFAKMLKSASEEELIEFVATAKLVFIDEKAKVMYGENGEKYFQAVIPKFYKKYKLLFV